MIEKQTFEVSGLIKNQLSKEEIEFWGHDAGEFVWEEIQVEMEDLIKMEPEEEKG